MNRSLYLVVLCALPTQAAAPPSNAPTPSWSCRIMSGEVVSVLDPRFRNKACVIEPGVTIRAGIEELPPSSPPVPALNKVRRLSAVIHVGCTDDQKVATAQTAALRRVTEEKLVESGFQPDAASVIVGECGETSHVEVEIVEVWE